MPWLVLRQRGGNAEQTLLLDYITPLTWISLFRSIRSRHWLAAAAVVGTVALQTLALLSTGLLTSRTRIYTETLSNGTSITKFDPISYKGGIERGFNAQYATQNQKSWQLYFETTKYNMPFPRGTTDHHVYQQFDHTSIGNNTSAALVDVFSPDLMCEAAEVVDISQGSTYSITDTWTVSSQGCSGIKISPSSTQFSQDTESMVFAVAANCTDQMPGDDASRLTFLAGSFGLQNVMHTTTGSYIPPPSSSYSNYTAVICRPVYSVQKALVSFNSSTVSDSVPAITFNSSSRPSQIPTLSAWDVARPMSYTFCSTHSTDDEKYWSPASIQHADNATLTFTDVLQAVYIHDLSKANTTMLGSVASTFFRSWATQMAGLYLAVPANERISYFLVGN